MTKRLLIRGFMILAGLLLLYSSYGYLSTALILKGYKESFQHLSHPDETTSFDSFGFKFSYYPATYRDESIKHKCAYLVGELRGYTGKWKAVQTFYQDQSLIQGDGDTAMVGTLPIEFISGSGRPTSMDMVENISYSPFGVDILARLASHYYFWGYPKEMVQSHIDVYAVYIAPDCE